MCDNVFDCVDGDDEEHCGAVVPDDEVVQNYSRILLNEEQCFYWILGGL